MKKHLKTFINKPKIVFILSTILAIIIGIYGYTNINKARENQIAKAKDGFIGGEYITTNTQGGNQHLTLGFLSAGRIKSVLVKVGDNVKSGQVLARLDAGNAEGALTEAKAAYSLAEANYQKVINGATGSSIDVAKAAVNTARVNLEQAKKQQDLLVSNARATLLNSTPEAVPTSGTSDYTAPTISGNYNLGQEGVININTYYTGNGLNFTVSGLTTGNGVVTNTTPQPIGDSGLYIKFPSTSNNVTSWTISIPNKKASNYLTNLNAYQAALKTQQSALSSSQSVVDQRNAELAVKKSSARSADIDLAKADIISAEGQMQSAEANYNNTIITAPADGTITSVDVKLGELATAQKEVMVLQDISNVYLEANINEANITNVSIGMPVDVNFDAFGSDKVFNGVVSTIDPASTIISGVVNYKVTTSIDQIKDLRPGMTANMTIKSKEKDHVLLVQSRAILTDKSGNKTIRIVNDTKKKSFKEVPITTGLEGDGGMAEVLSGVHDGDEFVVLIKK